MEKEETKYTAVINLQLVIYKNNPKTGECVDQVNSTEINKHLKTKTLLYIKGKNLDECIQRCKERFGI